MRLIYKRIFIWLIQSDKERHFEDKDSRSNQSILKQYLSKKNLYNRVCRVIIIVIIKYIQRERESERKVQNKFKKRNYFIFRRFGLARIR